ncbi:MAG: ChbG/HpnK family deacetylase [Candidatus Methylacidiphilales bacterium]|nr:ChbG/HpnK family deacetylase [Candidatus Methylacidiphilales bacterium]
MTQVQNTLRVVTRGDDAGSSLSANRAIRTACNEGILRNVSVMAPGPYLKDAWEQLRDFHEPDRWRGVAFGLHVCLTSEWDYPRWGPVAPAARVQSLVVEDGCFPKTCAQLQQKVVLSEMLLEVEAQLDAMRRIGFRPVYMDEHMGVGWVNGLSKELAKLAMREKLVYKPALTPVPLGGNTVQHADYATPFLQFLRSRTAVERCQETYLAVGHPAYDDDEMRAMRTELSPPGEVSRDRVGQRILFLRQDVQDFFYKEAVAVRYDEI